MLLAMIALVVTSCGVSSKVAPIATGPDGRISGADAAKQVQAGALIVDVRAPDEYESGHISVAPNVPHEAVADNLAVFGGDKDRAIILYCKSGRRAGIAREALLNAGYKHVYNAGGYSDISGNFK